MNNHFPSRSLSFFPLAGWIQFCRTLIFLGLSFWLIGIGHAVTYVVSPSGNDTSTNGDLSTPFSTIEKALSVAQPGDSVQLRAGTYREAINPPRSGTAQNPIVIEAYPGESVTVSALDEVSGPWTAAANGIYTCTVAGTLPVSFWTSPNPSAAGSQFVENGGQMVGTMVNETGSTTRSMTSTSPNAAWNFFTQAVTWKVRGLSIASAGTKALPGANAYLWLSIMSPRTTSNTVSTSAYASDDAATVRFDGTGKMSLYLKKNTANSLGTEVVNQTVSGINGYDLTLGPASGGSVPYTLVVKRSSGGDIILSGSWAISQTDWSDSGDGSTSHLQIFAQENASPSPDLTQKFQFTVGSYIVSAGTSTLLRDEFDDNELATVDDYPSGLNATVTSGYDQVFVDGVMQHEARSPNFGTGGLLSPATTSVTMSRDTDVPNNTITSSTFSGKSNNFYANARFMGAFGGAWSWQNAVVTNSSGSTLTFDLATKSEPWWPGTESWQSKNGVGFVYGLLNLLDADGEWYFAPATGQLSLRPTGGGDPSSRRVEIKRRNWCVNINGLDYITVRGIQTVGGAIKLNGVGNVLSNCDASYLSHFLTFSNGYLRDGGKAQGGGVILGGSGGAVRNCTISNTAGPGVYTSGTEHNITRNKIFNANYAGIFTGGVVLDGEGEVLAFNTVYDCGRDVIEPNGVGSTIVFNDLYGSGKLCKDLGVIYTSYTDALSPSGKKTRIAYNWVHDGNLNDPLSKGIYLDNFNRNFQVDHNVVWNFFGTSVSTALQDGIKMNSPADGHALYHNTLFDCGSYNENTYNSYPSETSVPYWTDTNQHLIYIAQNNLVLTDSGASLENIASKDFRPKAGTSAIDPATTSGITTWTTPNGTANVPPTFSFNKGEWTGTFTYEETTGQGVILPGVNDWVADSKPDSGAYERGIAAWTAGISAWEGLKQDAPPSVGAIAATLQCVRVAPNTAATHNRVYYGTIDGGTNPSSWSSARDLGTTVPTDVQTVHRPVLSSLSQNTTYYARFRVTSANIDSWSDATSFTTGTLQTPTITTPPTAAMIVLGQLLSSVNLTGGASSVPGIFTWTDPTIQPPVGTSSQSVTFTPTDSASYTTTLGTIDVTVSPFVTKTWSGGGAGANWDTGANWDGAVPGAGSDLVFSGTNQLSSTNNLTAGTLFSSITFANTKAGSTGFTLNGNPITLGGNIATAATTSGTGSITDTMILGLILSGDRTINVGAGHNLNYGTSNSASVISSTGNFGLTKEGPGSLLLRGCLNTFSGNFSIHAGTVQVGASSGNATIGNRNVPGAIGAGSVINLGASSGNTNATLTYGSSISDSTDRTILLGNSTGEKTIQATGTGNLTLNGTITRGSNHLTLGVGTTSTLRVESQLSGPGVLTKINVGKLSLTGETSDFTGEIRINDGTLEFTSIASNGVASSLGKGSNNTSIRVGYGGGSGTLNYVGNGNATDRQIRIGSGNGSGSAIVNNNGANGGTGLRFNNPSFNVSTANTTAGSRTLTLGGTNTDANTIAGTITNNSGAGAVVNLTKAGNGRWILSGTNKYSGSTSVTGGILSMANPSLADGADVSIATGATLDLNFSGTDTIGKLILQGAEQAQGTWGSPTSNAHYKTESITGTGVLNVTVGNILQATPTVTIPPIASAINSGETLASSTLSGGVASVAGTFAWTDPTLQPAVGTSSYSVTFTPTDTFYYTNATTPVSVTVNAAGYPTWVGGYNWAGGDSSPTGDPDGDGLANLVEYATGQNPTVANANPITFRQVEISGSSYLQLSVNRNPAVTNVLIEGLSAGTLSDPAAWSTLTTVTVTDTPLVFAVRDSLPVESNEKRFLYLRFTLQP